MGIGNQGEEEIVALAAPPVFYDGPSTLFRRTSDLPEAHPVDNVQVAVASPISNRRFFPPAILVVLVSFIAIAVGLSVGLTVSRSSQSQQTTSLQLIHVTDALLLDFRSRLPRVFLEAIDTQGSPQSRAYKWVEGHLPLMVRDEDDAVLRLAQRFALVSFFYSTNGDSDWVNTTGWLNYSVPECAWFGCECDGDFQSITQVDLTLNGLRGRFSSPALELVLLGADFGN
jgi:hypothetical protein